MNVRDLRELLGNYKDTFDVQISCQNDRDIHEIDSVETDDELENLVIIVETK